MTADESRRQPARGGRGLASVLAVVLVGGMVVLAVVLLRGRDGGRKALEAYVASMRAGATVSTSVAAGEADAVTKALRETESFSIGN